MAKADEIAARVEALRLRVADRARERSVGVVEGMCIAARLMLGRGELEAARAIHAEALRRFPGDCGTTDFLDLDEALHDALDETSQPKPKRRKRKNA